MQVVTIASHRPTQDYYVYDQFFKSLERFGVTPLVLGRNGSYGGLGTKPKILKRAIESGLIKDDKMIFTDCFDVLFQQHPGKSLDYLKQGIIFNAETACFPDTNMADNHPPSRTKFRYFNSGFSVGYTQSYLDALKEMNADGIPPDTKNADDTWNTPNDQGYWMKQYLFGNVPITLDTNCKICQTTHDVTPDELDFSEDLIRNKETGTIPIAFHLNGRKEEWKPILLNRLNLL